MRNALSSDFPLRLRGENLTMGIGAAKDLGSQAKRCEPEIECFAVKNDVFRR
jgi:hypothetical protein